MYCTECGTGNPPDSKYCKECGHKINAGYRTMMLSVQDTQAIEDEAQQERLTKLLDMAFWHNEAGNADAAVLACDAALAIHPDNTTAHSLLGSLYEKKGDDEKAIKHFERVLAINPESAADAVKLDQLRRGVHVKAVAPPVHYKWIPPALANFSVVGLKEKAIAVWEADQKRGPDKIAPILGAGLAALVVFGVGLLLLWPRVQAHPVPVRVRPGAPVSVANAAYGEAGRGASTASALPAPIVLPARSAPSRPLSVGAIGDGPFGETLKPGTKDVVPLARPAPLPSAGTGRAGRGGKIAALPPLSLSAVSGGVAPAPVSVPAGVAAPLPQHTVVVRDLGQAAPAPSQAAYVPTAPAVPNSDGGADNTPSRIRITINSGGDQASPAAPAESRPTPASFGGGESMGETYQQAALGLQQQGDFRRARAAYQKAIDAYQAQIAAGRDTEAAQRGLQACQTGIQICQQSQS